MYSSVTHNNNQALLSLEVNILLHYQLFGLPVRKIYQAAPEVQGVKLSFGDREKQPSLVAEWPGLQALATPFSASSFRGARQAAPLVRCQKSCVQCFPGLLSEKYECLIAISSAFSYNLPAKTPLGHYFAFTV